MTPSQAAEMLNLLREIRDLLAERGSAQPEAAPKNFAELRPNTRLLPDPLYRIDYGVAPPYDAHS